MKKVLNSQSALVNYVFYACVLMFITLSAFAISNFVLIRTLNRTYQARTQYLIENAVAYLDNRFELLIGHGVTVSMDNTIPRLTQYHAAANSEAFNSAAVQITHTLNHFIGIREETVDILLFHDDLDVFFNAGSFFLHRSMLSGNDAVGTFNIDYSWMASDKLSGFAIIGRYLVYYNNTQPGVHVYMILCHETLSSLVNRLIPSTYGLFVMQPRHLRHGNISLSNHAAEPPEQEPDVRIYGPGRMFVYTFYTNNDTYSGIIYMTFMSIVIATLCVLLVAILLQRIKKRLYDPLRTVLDAVGANSMGLSGKRNEFTLILEGIDLMQTTLSQLNDSHRHLTFHQGISAEAMDDLRSNKDFNEKLFCAVVTLFEDKEGNKETYLTNHFMKAAQQFEYYPLYTINKYNIFFFFPRDENTYKIFVQWISDYIKGNELAQCGISALYSQPHNIKDALDESIRLFHELPAHGLTITQNVATPAGNPADKKCHIPSRHLFKLISEAMSGHVNEVQQHLLEILAENETANADAKRQMILCLYDTLCMVIKKDPKEESLGVKFENIYNLQILFDSVCNRLVQLVAMTANEENMLLWVDDHLLKDISLHDLAEAMNISYNYAGKLFKDRAGVSFIEYLHRKRVERAIRLMDETDMIIEEIAGAVGFASITNFFRVFKKITGVTPNMYRANMQA